MILFVAKMFNAVIMLLAALAMLGFGVAIAFHSLTAWGGLDTIFGSLAAIFIFCCSYCLSKVCGYMIDDAMKGYNA